MTEILIASPSSDLPFPKSLPSSTAERSGMRIYRVTYTYRTWKHKPKSPFATASVDYQDPSAAHEAALKLRNQGHANIRIDPMSKPNTVK